MTLLILRLKVTFFCGRQYLARALVVVTLFAFATPNIAGIVPFRMNESKSPIETEGEPLDKIEEVLGNRHRRFRMRLGYRKPQTNAFHTVHTYLQVHSNSAPNDEGHRLSNGLLAPLTC